MSIAKVDFLPDDLHPDELMDDIGRNLESIEALEERRIQYIGRLKIMVQVLGLNSNQLKWAIGESEINEETSWEKIEQFFDGILELLSSGLPKFGVPGGERTPLSYKNPHEDIAQAFGETSYEKLLGWINLGVRNEIQGMLH